MQESERSLRQDIDHCIDLLQNIIDTECTESISIFSKKTNENEQWLGELKSKFLLKDDNQLQNFQKLKDEQKKKLDEMEQKVEYYESLCIELEEIQNELEVKTKLYQKRKNRNNDV